MPRNIQLAEPPTRFPVKVTKVEALGDEIYCIRLASPFSLWEPGDCIGVYKDGASPVSRPYSLSGAVADSELELWVRRFPGGEVSEKLTRSRPGDVLYISPPFGYFRPAKPDAVDKLYFATGTGIAPFLSAVRSGAAMPRRIYWGLRYPLTLDPSLDRLPITVSYSRAGPAPGRITRGLKDIPITGNTHIYACGLDRMIEEILGFFSERGVEESRLHRECFFTQG